MYIIIIILALAEFKLGFVSKLSVVVDMERTIVYKKIPCFVRNFFAEPKNGAEKNTFWRNFGTGLKF